MSKYATAAHLALMGVAPLVLFPFCAQRTVAVVLLWLSALALVWVLMEPSCRSGEMPHNARRRAGGAIVRDPLFWTMLVVVAFAAVRALNGGIALDYDAEAMTWLVRPPAMPLVAGCVDGAGFLPFAACVALTVLLMGARHSIGREASLAFYVSLSVFSGLSAAVSAFALSYGNEAVLALARASYLTPSFAGVAYGLNLLCGVVALFGCAGERWVKAEPVVALSILCNAIGLVIFSPVVTAAAFLLLFLVFVVIAFALQSREATGSGSFRCAVAVLACAAALVAFVMVADNGSPVAEKREAALALKPFPDDFAKTRAALSSVAFGAWKARPWLGSGIGAFPLDLRFGAAESDWRVISPEQSAPMNGWWHLLAERGIVDALFFAVVLGFLLWSYVSRMVFSFGGYRWQPPCLLAPIVLVALVAGTFVDSSFLRADVLLSGCAALALSAGAFPAKARPSHHGEI